MAAWLTPEYWGKQVPALAARYRVVVMDSRGHGRSSRDARPFGYDVMTDDVVGLMDLSTRSRTSRFAAPPNRSAFLETCGVVLLERGERYRACAPRIP